MWLARPICVQVPCPLHSMWPNGDLFCCSKPIYPQRHMTINHLRFGHEADLQVG